jgi:hypothetical protein
METNPGIFFHTYMYVFVFSSHNGNAKQINTYVINVVCN